MSTAEQLLPEFEHEMRSTRALLAVIPDTASGWKPHQKSMTMGQLAIHLPGLVSWIPGILSEHELDVTGPASKNYFVSWESTAATLAFFDGSVARSRAALAAASDAQLMELWTLRAGDRVISTLPRQGVIRTMVMNHIIHHRGQLTVYLRLNDVPLPETYGPTADSVR